MYKINNFVASKIIHILFFPLWIKSFVLFSQIPFCCGLWKNTVIRFALVSHEMHAALFVN